jgi:hypothetical protein
MRTFPIFLWLTALLVPNLLSAQTFEDRREQYIDSALTNFNSNSMCIEAYENVVVTQSELDSIFDVMQTKTTIDFQIVKLVRVMMLGGGTYDNQIVPQLNSVPYWINNYDTIRGYWSENHMIMWMSSDWIMHEYTGRPADATLEQRLKHYLNLKIDYGFYEYFSSTYAPYSLSGLLNLADFAQDAEIKSLAIAASKRLMKDLLMVTNDQGVFYPVAGRNYTSKYMSAYGQNHSSVIWLLTGLGPAPSEATHAGGFLATTSIDFSDVSSSWTSTVDTLYSLGHTLQEGFVINQNLSPLGRTIFQWSSGTYFHPEVVVETVSLLNDSNMWNHVDFELINTFAGFPVEQYPSITEGLSVVTYPNNTNVEVSIFKNGPVTLCSNEDFYKGKVGFQQWPACANSGTSAVFTASGRVEEDWRDRNPENANYHLPYVDQTQNVSLIMYRPEEMSVVLPFQQKEVALYWVDSVYDEIVEDGLWLIGREADGYVAVRRHCTDYIDGVRACEMNKAQSWVIVVGNDDMYGSFSNFQSLVGQSQFTEEWLVTLSGDSTYHASIDFDNKFIEHYWDPLEFVGIEEATENGTFSLWPNPAMETVNIDLSAFEKAVDVSVVNNLGQVIYWKKISGQNRLILPISNWADGIYSVTIRDNEKVASQKLVKQ